MGVSLRSRALSCVALALLLSGCGAGLVTGITANENSGSSSSPPELTVPSGFPLVPAPNTTRTVVVTNAQIPAASPLRVTLAALGQEVDQLAPVVTGQGGSTAITFTLDTAAIVGTVADPTAVDVPAQLRVLVDDRPIAEAAEVVLARQPAVTLEAPSQTPALVSPFGETVTLRVGGLVEIGANDLQMLVETADPGTGGGGTGFVTRLCTGLTAAASGVAGEAIVSASLPGNAFPGRARLYVRHVTSGQSTGVDLFYRPEVTLALPSQGVTTGGNLVTLVGTALVPYDFSQSPAQLDFERVELSFDKGGRVTTLARENFREKLSAGDRLVFRMPASPDGRPGEVDIVVRAQLEGVIAEVTASQVFLFANPNPFFGPRGAVLDRPPVAVAPILLDEAPSFSDTPDFVVLSEEGGVGFLELLLSQGNGMFQRFGARRQIGNHEVAAERDPRDVCTGDFDGDEVPDMFLVNAGEAVAMHHLVLGQAKPSPPLGAVHRIPGDPGMGRCFAALVDGDDLPDVVLVPGPEAPPGQLPQVLLSRPVAIGQPAFTLPITIPIDEFAFQASTVADLDRDGNVDFASVDGQALELGVVFGNGDGTFGSAFHVPFSIPTTPPYTADPGSTAVGLHACDDYTLGVPSLQSLALVMSGDNDGQGSDPAPVVVVLPQNTARVFAQPLGENVQSMGAEPIGASLVVNLDPSRDDQAELVAGLRGDPAPGSQTSVGVFRFVGSRFDPFLPFEGSDEFPRTFRALYHGRAFPETQNPNEGTAVFAVHESEVDGEREQRLSTLLVLQRPSGPALLTPDAGIPWPFAVEGIIGGNWSATAVAGRGGVRDLAIAYTDTDNNIDYIEMLENDGFGGFPTPTAKAAVPGVLGATLQLVPAPSLETESLVFLDVTSRLGCWIPGGAVVGHSSELRQLAQDPALHSTELAPSSRLRVEDVDGDGVQDVIALLRFAIVDPDEDDSLLVVVRGDPNAASSSFQFVDPVAATAVHGRGTSITLGNFAASTSGTDPLELALAIPEAVTAGGLDGDHVRFFRLAAGALPEQDRFVPSSRTGGPQALIAGSRPSYLVAGDFDRDGLVDLLVAAEGDDTLRHFRNTSLPAAAGAEVEVGAFVQALSSPRALPPGTPTALRLGDVNGDGALDAIAAVVGEVAEGGHKAVAFYLSEEPGLFGDAEFVASTRLGDRDGNLSFDLGDWNRDGVLDLFVAWGATEGRNVRVLFGGSR